jgi:hypothetical protein
MTVTHKPEQFLIKSTKGCQWRVRSYVYVIQWGEEGPVKIGIAVDPVLRFNELQGANWAVLHLTAVIPVFGSALALEQASHKIAAEYRIRGEWFDLAPIEAVSAVLAAAKQIGADVLPLAEAEIRAKDEASRSIQLALKAEEREHRRQMRVRLGME